MREALDFHVEIGPGGEDGYAVTLRGSDGGEAASLLRLPLTRQELDHLLARIPDAVLASSARVRRLVNAQERPVQEFGRTLFDALLTGEGRSLLAASRHHVAREGRQLRLVLRVRPPELARLPWEFLFDSGQNAYVCPTTPLIRHPQVSVPVRPLRVQPPLRVLCMIARPGDQVRLAASAEQRRLEEALAPLREDGRIELGWVEGESWRDLRAALRRGSPAAGGQGRPWHVFHFIGHGGFDAVAQEGALALTGEDGRTYHLGAENLAMVLQGHPSLRLVVLNACDTGRSSVSDPFSSVAGALMREGLPAALAMQYMISDQAAIEFSRAFYEGLAHQLPVDVAVMDARQAIRLALPGTLEWGTPVLHMRSLDGYLFDIADAPRIRAVEVDPATVDAGDIGGSPSAAGSARLRDLYRRGAAALRAERWDEAVEAFRHLAARDRGYQDCEAKLDLARRGQRLAGQYAAGAAAAEAAEWTTAFKHLSAVVESEPGYRDAEHLLARARQWRTAEVLRSAAAQLHDIGAFEAVVALGGQLAALDPDGADPDGMIASARAALGGEPEPPSRAPARAEDRPPGPGGDPDQDTSGQQPDTSGQQPDTSGQEPDISGRQPAPQDRAPLGPGSARPERLTVPEYPAAVAFSPDGARLVVACDRRTARVLDVDGTVLLRLRHGNRIIGTKVLDAAFDPAGERLATAGDDCAARLWDARTGDQLLKVSHHRAVRAVAFSPDGARLATAGDDGTARIWSGSTEVRRVSHSKWVNEVVFSPDGSLLATTSGDGTARIWDADTGTCALTVSHDYWVKGVAFSPDGSLLATGSGDGTARIWDAASGEELLRLTHSAWVGAVAFGPDGSLLATAAGDRTARLWDTRTGQSLRAFPHLDWVNDVAFDADGSRFATACGDRTVRLWTLGEEQHG